MKKQKPPCPPEYVSVKTTYERLDVSEKTVRRWLAGRKLPFHRVGGQIRIAEKDLAEFLAKNKQW